MKRFDRSKITEEPIIDADQSWKLNYLKQLREARETGKPLSEIIDADAAYRARIQKRYPTLKFVDTDKSQADHIRIQARILRETSERISLRRMK